MAEPGEADALQVDHVVPRSWGGADALHNYQPLCTRCNRRKGNKRADDWRTVAQRDMYPPPTQADRDEADQRARKTRQREFAIERERFQKRVRPTVGQWGADHGRAWREYALGAFVAELKALSPGTSGRRRRRIAKELCVRYGYTYSKLHEGFEGSGGPMFFPEPPAGFDADGRFKRAFQLLPGDRLRTSSDPLEVTRVTAHGGQVTAFFGHNKAHQYSFVRPDYPVELYLSESP